MDQIKPEFLKKLTKVILVSIWVLSVLVTHNFDICKFTIQLVTHAVGKNYMFLLCNGLLVFIAKCSGLIASSKPTEENCSFTTDKIFDHRDFESYNAILELEYNSNSDHGPAESDFFLADGVIVEEDTKQQETTQERQEVNDGDEECEGSIKEEEENVEVMTSTEEDMNKKFDEFIRKMKEELRIEAKQQLILV